MKKLLTVLFLSTLLTSNFAFSKPPGISALLGGQCNNFAFLKCAKPALLKGAAVSAAAAAITAATLGAGAIAAFAAVGGGSLTSNAGVKICLSAHCNVNAKTTMERLAE